MRKMLADGRMNDVAIGRLSALAEMKLYVYVVENHLNIVKILSQK